MEKFGIRLRRYNDVFNVELKKRFYDCYKIDLMNESGSDILMTVIWNRKTGIVYNSEQKIIRTEENSSFFSSSYRSRIFINEQFVCDFYIANPMRNLIGKRQKHEVKFSDGRTVYLRRSNRNLSLKKHQMLYSLYENDVFIGEINTSETWDYFKVKGMNYQGQMNFSKNYSLTEGMLLLYFVLLDCLYLDERH